MHRLLSRLYFSSSKGQKLLTSTTLILLSCFIFWCLVGEVFVFMLSSGGWKWPTPLHLEKVQSQDTTTTMPQIRTYYQDGSTHHYALGSYKRLSAKERKQVSHNGYLKIMFISDPHIMCTHNKEEWWLARWDADTYLKKSFSRLHSRLKPDLLVFLGDTFSNGFEATDKQWDDYLQCLKDIYPIFSSSEKEKVIVAMGDNDLGGEGHDLMTQTVYRRYHETFGNLNNIFDITDGIRIIKITTTCFLRPPSTRAEVDCRENLVHFLDTSSQHPKKTSLFGNHLTILITHVPLNELSKSIQFSYNGRAVDIRTKILLTLRPGVVVSGHIHHEEYTQHKLEEWMVSEITVPTCSYRMGELSMGVGTAVVSEGGNMAYKVNWLPPRYPFVFGYILLGASLFLLCVCLTFRRC